MKLSGWAKNTQLNDDQKEMYTVPPNDHVYTKGDIIRAGAWNEEHDLTENLIFTVIKDQGDKVKASLKIQPHYIRLKKGCIRVIPKDSIIHIGDISREAEMKIHEQMAEYEVSHLALAGLWPLLIVSNGREISLKADEYVNALEDYVDDYFASLSRKETEAATKYFRHVAELTCSLFNYAADAPREPHTEILGDFLVTFNWPKQYVKSIKELDNRLDDPRAKRVWKMPYKPSEMFWINLWFLANRDDKVRQDFFISADNRKEVTLQ